MGDHRGSGADVLADDVNPLAELMGRKASLGNICREAATSLNVNHCSSTRRIYFTRL